MDSWYAEPDSLPGMDVISPYMASTGLEYALLKMYELTENNKYRDFVVDFRGLTEWEVPIVKGRWGKIDGHAYSYLSRCLAQLELNRIEPDPSLLEKSRSVMSFLREGDGLLINGAVSYQECWHDTQYGFFKLGETCATAYLLRVLDRMLRMDGDAWYGDVMERVIYNALFAAQSPDGRRLRYYVPFTGQRIYFDRDTYCCPCNYRRIVAELPSFICYGSDEGAVVNLYSPSRCTIPAVDGDTITITQSGDYFGRGEMNIEIKTNSEREQTIRFRIPGWCTEAPAITVEGESFTNKAVPGDYLTVTRDWSTGAEVRIVFPMKYRLIRGRKAQAGRAAVMRGPLLYTLNPEHNRHIPPEQLRLLRIDLASPSYTPNGDSELLLGGESIVRFWSPGSYIGPPDYEAVLTPFPDPNGEAAYFLVRNPENQLLMHDELIAITE
jgi:hypothetical protein